MNRRKFLRNAALLSTPILCSGIPVFAGSGLSDPLLNALNKGTSSCNKILVIIQLNGGNDGLNTIIPRDRYSELASARNNILIPAASVLPLTNTITTGMHPAMTGLRDLYNNGKVAIVQGVSYPNPSFSHFQAQDVWFTASDVNQTLETGWLGRDLDLAYPNFPNGYPNGSAPDPLAIQIGGALPLSLQGPNINMGFNAPDPDSLLAVVNETSSPAPPTDYGDELTFLRLMKDQSNAYSSRIKATYLARTTMSTMYPTSSSSLAEQLKIVARLIGGGLTTPVYIVNHGDSFDTHANQVTAPNATTTGTHATSLSRLSVAIAAFQDDLTLMGKSGLVTGMTFSEFGRRVASNGNGTDHGTAAPVIFFGDGVNGGIIGTSPVLPAAPTATTQVPTQFDFRQLYATVMQDWLCMDSSEAQTVLNGNFNTLSIFNTSIPLPIANVLLEGKWDGNFARLSFTVNSNDAVDHFIIDRSGDAKVFSAVATIVNYSNNSNEHYAHKDERINVDEVFYRVKAITRQGEARYSNTVRMANRDEAQLLRVYPNPVTNYTINIEFLKAVDEYVEVTIYGSYGEKLFYDQRILQGNKLRVQVPDMFSPETLYILKVNYGLQEVKEKLFFAR